LTKKSKDLASLRNDIQAYVPGRKLLPAGDKTRHDYVIPQKTVLLLVGDMGAGKSTLVNNIHRAVNNTRADLDIAATASELQFVPCALWVLGRRRLSCMCPWLVYVYAIKDVVLEYGELVGSLESDLAGGLRASDMVGVVQSWEEGRLSRSF
jgi:energy-coupling factor transporter ATP-binding protein EcfA2